MTLINPTTIPNLKKYKIITKAYSGFTVRQLPLIEVLKLYIDGVIQIERVWLQRLSQSDAWTKKQSEKARSFLSRLLMSGSTSKSTFTCVNIDLLIKKIEETIKTASKEESTGKIFKDMLSNLQEMKERGCKLILLDGQNRLEHAIKPFFSSDLDFYYKSKLTGNTKSIRFIDTETNQHYEKKQFTFNSLNKDEQHFINNILVTVCFGHEGEIDEFLEDLIDDNSGEHWNEFERFSTSIKTINYLVNTGLAKGIEGKEYNNVPELKLVLDSVGKMSGAYHQEKKGYNKVLCELIQYIAVGEKIEVDYDVISDETKRDKFVSAYETLKTFFKKLATDISITAPQKGKDPVIHFASKEMLRNLYFLVEILEKGSCGAPIKMKQINMKHLLDAFKKFHTFKNSRIKNASEYTKVGDKMVPSVSTWIWAQKSVGKDEIKLRQDILLTWVKDNINSWIDKGFFLQVEKRNVDQHTKDYIKAHQTQDIYSAYGQPLDGVRDNVHVDHLLQKGVGGSDKPENLAATTSSSNLSRVKGKVSV